MGDGSVDRSTERALWILTGAELAAVAVFFLLLAGSTFGGGTFLSSVSRRVRLVALALLAIELLLPLVVYLDVRRRPDGPDPLWIHVVAMPAINLFGIVAYLADRSETQSE